MLSRRPLPIVYEPQIPPIPSVPIVRPGELRDIPDQIACYGEFFQLDLREYGQDPTITFSADNVPTGLSIQNQRFLQGINDQLGKTEVTIHADINGTITTKRFDFMSVRAGKWTPSVAGTLIPNYNVHSQKGSYQEVCNVVNFAMQFQHRYRRNWQLGFASHFHFDIYNGTIYTTQALSTTRTIQTISDLPEDGHMLDYDDQVIGLPQTDLDKFGFDISVQGDYIYSLGHAGEQFFPKLYRFNLISNTFDPDFEIDVHAYHIAALPMDHRWNPQNIVTTPERIYLIGNVVTALTDGNPYLLENYADLVSVPLAIQAYDYNGNYIAADSRVNLLTPHSPPNAPDFFGGYARLQQEVSGYATIWDLHSAWTATPTHLWGMFSPRRPYTSANLAYEPYVIASFPIVNNRISERSDKYLIVDSIGRAQAIFIEDADIYYTTATVPVLFSRGSIVERGINRLTAEEWNYATNRIPHQYNYVDFDPPVGAQISNITGTVTQDTTQDHVKELSTLEIVDNKIRVIYNADAEFNGIVNVSGQYFIEGE